MDHILQNLAALESGTSEKDQMTVTLDLPELDDSSDSRFASTTFPADSESTHGTVRAAQKQLRAKLYRIVVVPDQSLAGQSLEKPRSL